ncbi:MAG TPA: SGNH/GDSL hydrolase family protein [Anaerolineae bacterium]|nr:SGNH/GDSL hydrolase family protein [Anaerolineae bacterium]
MVKRTWQSFLSLNFGLLAGFFLAEIGARFLYPLPVELKNSETIKVGLPPAYIQYVDRMPWSHSVTRYEVAGEYTTVVSINSQGLRGPDIPYEKPAGEFRILYIGDSFVKAIQVDFEDTVYQQLETLLRATPGQYEVIGAGEAGWGTDQAYMYYLHEGYHYQPDLVIYQFVPNDVTNNVRELFPRAEGLRQHFTLEDGKLVGRNLDINQSQSYLYAIALHRHLLVNLRLYALIGDLWPGRGASFLAQPVYNQIGEAAPASKTAKPSPQLLIYQEPYEDNYNTAWDLTEAILSEWSQRVRQDGALLAVVSVPGNWAIYEEDWQEIPERFPSIAAEFAGWNRDQPDEYLGSLTQRLDIPYLSLTSTFRTYAAENEQHLYVPNDGHWTEAGHALAAQTTFEWLAEQNLLP